jgi:hydrogenase-4 component E
MPVNLFTNLTNLLAFASLGAVFALILRNSLSGQAQMFALQSALLALLASVVALYAQSIELFAVAVALLIVKGGVIPYVLQRAVKRIGMQPNVSPYLGIVATLVISGALIIVAYYVMAPIVASDPLPTASAIPLAFAGILVSLFVTVIRRRALTQILGFLMLENSIFLLALLTTYGVPFIVEIGVFLDVLVAVLIMEVFVYRIKENFDTLEVGQMGELKG